VSHHASPALIVTDSRSGKANSHCARPPTIPVISGNPGGGLAQWLFAFPDRLSVTISAGDAWCDTPREELAERIWADVAKVAGLSGPAPPWQIVRERRATFAATPAQDARRPGPRTRWANLALAGDWTQTKLPATIEGAIRSGVSAAKSLEQTVKVRLT